MEKYNNIIKGLDKYDTMLENKKIYSTIDETKFNEVKDWLANNNRVEWLKMFATKKSCWKFFLNCAKESFPGSKERIRELNKIMNMPTYVEEVRR